MTGTPWAKPGLEYPARLLGTLGEFSPTSLSTEYEVDFAASIAQYWIDEPHKNYGVVVDDINANTGNDGINFWSSQHSVVAERPLLSVTVTIP